MKKINIEEIRELIAKHITKYRLIYSILIGLVAIFELALLIRGLILFSFKNYKHYIYIASYIFLFITSSSVSILIHIGKYKNFSNKVYNILTYSYSVAIIIWSLLISYLDMKVGNGPIVYLTVVITIAGVVILEPIFFVSILLISYGFLIYFDSIGGFKYFISSAEFINCSVFVIMAAFVGIRHFFVSYKEYKNATILETCVLEERNRVKNISLQTILSISNAVDAKDKYTREHSQRVAEYSKIIASKLNWSTSRIKEINQIALLHDIGKIGVPDSILNCTGALTKEEFEQMKMHTVIGGEILKDLTILKNVDLGAKYHHERYDGTGYPSGLKGEEIPIEARIIAIADAFDAMNSNRIYRQRLSKEVIINELVNGKGKQFDPELIDLFLPEAQKLLNN